LWLGLGSNLLVRDGGFAGTVISTSGLLQGIAVGADGSLRLEAGVSCPKVARLSVAQGASGLEFLAGIPGSMGGALAMNAGAFGGQTWEWVVSVETMDRQGRLRVREPGDFRIGYREVVGPPGEWFVAAHLRLARAAGVDSAARIKALLQQRHRSQPVGLPSAGSVFRNPPGGVAARLIEACGLKGARVGGAAVSEKHANFIITRDEATAADIETLIARVAEAVATVHGLRLVPEVHVVGDPAQPGGTP
jgi:UDP-N-acetylmuramate dehydrogenase